MEDNRISHDIYCQAIGQLYLDSYIRALSYEKRVEQYNKLIESLQAKLSQKEVKQGE